MQAELPIIRIHETDFFVDLRNMQFVQVDQPDNCILFDHVQDHKTFSTLLYDTATKNAFSGTWDQFVQSTVTVRLPLLEELDPPTMRLLMQEQGFPSESVFLRAAKYMNQFQKENKTKVKNQKRK